MAGGRGLRRAGAGMADQALYSLTNFALTILVARSVTPDQFGAFSLIVATYLITVSVTRGLTSESFLIRYSARIKTGRESSRWQYGASAASGTSFVIGVVVGAVLVALGLTVLHHTLGHTAVVFGFLLPGLLAQDLVRYVALAEGRPVKALVNDTVVAVVQLSASVALIVTHHASVSTLVLAWGIAGYLGALVGVVQVGVYPRPDRIWYWFSRHRDLAVRYAIDDAANQGAQQANAYIVAAVNGLADSGALRAAQTVFGPPSIANLGIMTAATPELVRLLARSPARMKRAALYLGLSQGAVGLVWAVVALVIPDPVGHALFGQTWFLAHPLLPFIGIAQVANGLRTGPMAGLRALGDARRTLRARGVITTLGLAATATGAALDGAMGVAIASACVTPVLAAVWSLQFRAAMADHQRRAAADPEGAPVAPTGSGADGPVVGAHHRAPPR